MKRSLLFTLLAATGLRAAGPFDDAAALLQSKKYPEAAAAFAALPAGGAESGQAAYLEALSQHLAGRVEAALAAADRVPGDSPWAMKAKFLKGMALTAAKRHREAEAIYAAEAARAFSPARRDVLVQALLELADEVMNPVASGEVNPPQPDHARALLLCAKVLELPITEALRDAVLFKKGELHLKAGDHQAAHAAFHAWLLRFDPTWTAGRPGGKAPAAGEVKHGGSDVSRLAARLHLAESLLRLGRFAEARVVAKDLGEKHALLSGTPDTYGNRNWAGDAAWLHVQTFAQQPRSQQPAQQMDMQQQQRMNFLPPQLQGAQGDAGRQGSAFQQFPSAVPFPTLPSVSWAPETYLKEIRAVLAAHAAHPNAPDASEAIARTLDQTDRSDAADKFRCQCRSQPQA